ncbi:hypothetical protein QVA66_10615 [Staphylococcus chromogenes]|nr:hypothetical protein [Staphylococcus chromogenes]
MHFIVVSVLYWALLLLVSFKRDLAKFAAILVPTVLATALASIRPAEKYELPALAFMAVVAVLSTGIFFWLDGRDR